jgi:hypothetical protein
VTQGRAFREDGARDAGVGGCGGQNKLLSRIVSRRLTEFQLSTSGGVWRGAKPPRADAFNKKGEARSGRTLLRLLEGFRQGQSGPAPRPTPLTSASGV